MPKRTHGFRYAANRRRFGTVGFAVFAVLSEAEEPMKLGTIHGAVEDRLGGEVSLNTVHDYLLRHLKGSNALFERPWYGHYCLCSSSSQCGTSVGD